METLIVCMCGVEIAPDEIVGWVRIDGVDRPVCAECAGGYAGVDLVEDE